MESMVHEPIHFAVLADGRKILLPHAEPVDIHPSAKFILHRGLKAPHPWTVTEVRTGMRVAEGNTRVEALKRARARVAAYYAEGDSIQSYVTRLSPRIAATA